MFHERTEFEQFNLPRDIPRHDTVADPGFPWGGCQPQKEGASLLFDEIFLKTA